jgi:hypothetical protein
LPERLDEEIAGPVRRRVVHGHDTHPGMRLRSERLEALAKPTGGVSRDEHDEDTGGPDGVGGGWTFS